MVYFGLFGFLLPVHNHGYSGLFPTQSVRVDNGPRCGAKIKQCKELIIKLNVI